MGHIIWQAQVPLKESSNLSCGMFYSNTTIKHCNTREICHSNSPLKRKVKSAYEPSGPSGRSLSRFS